MERNEPIPLLGLALRGGRLAIGEDAVRDTVRAGKARLLLLASDASDRTRRYAAGLSSEGQVLLLSLPCTKEELGRGLGRGDVAVTALTDAGLAAAVGQRLAALDPAACGDAAERLALKWKRAQERRENREKDTSPPRENLEKGSPPSRENREKSSPPPRENREKGSPPSRESREKGSPPPREKRKTAEARRDRARREGQPPIWKSRRTEGPSRDGPGRRKGRKPSGRRYGNPKSGGRRYGDWQPGGQRSDDRKPGGQRFDDRKPGDRQFGGRKPDSRRREDIADTRPGPVAGKARKPVGFPKPGGYRVVGEGRKPGGYPKPGGYQRSGEGRKPGGYQRAGEARKPGASRRTGEHAPPDTWNGQRRNSGWKKKNTASRAGGRPNTGNPGRRRFPKGNAE